ncbi:hypothetical protein F5B19DRAFT_352418 [Rostrohypoxylon terebratum]|nr:hypothetical protein F5B19DRAFT_352418 [Rostrohypoxylon terebratum]
MRRWLTKTKRRFLHKRLRTGCLECKTRNIKCNNKHPTCGNCEIADRECCFADEYAMLEEQPLQPRSSMDFRLISKLIKPPTTTKSWPPIRDSDDSQHLGLFHHVETSTPNQTTTTQPINALVQVHIDSTLSTSYLMNQLLAFSTQYINNVSSDYGRAYHNL